MLVFHAAPLSNRDCHLAGIRCHSPILYSDFFLLSWSSYKVSDKEFSHANGERASVYHEILAKAHNDDLVYATWSSVYNKRNVYQTYLQFYCTKYIESI